jgi:enterochelin esterase family protein
MKIPSSCSLVRFITTLGLLPVAYPLLAVDSVPTPPAAPVLVAQAPANPGQAPGPGGPRGGGGGRARGVPMTAEDQSAIVKLGELPAWKPGVGEGDYVMTPPYSPAPENAPRDTVPKGKVVTFHMDLAESKLFPPSAGRGGNSTNREVVVYIPAQYVPGTPAPLLLAHDAMGAHDTKPAPYLPDILDNMIADKRLPAMIAVMVMPSNQRSLEYDTVSGKYAEFIEQEVLPRVVKECNVAFSKDPDARATLGGSSGGAVGMSMAWFHPELYHRVMVYSGTFVNLRNGPDAPHGAWEYHENFIPRTTPNKPLRIWLEVGQNDNGSTSSGADMRNWVLANMHMASVLKAKDYHYQFVYAKEAGHVDRPVRAMTLAPALEWLWKDYKPAAK